MTLLHRLRSVLRWLVRRDGAEQDLNDELQAFVDMAAADRMRDGAPAAEARRLAVLHLGGVVLRPLRVSNPEGLVLLRQRGPGGDIFPFTSGVSGRIAPLAALHQG